jgi:hypothetical protein
MGKCAYLSLELLELLLLLLSVLFYFLLGF